MTAPLPGDEEVLPELTFSMARASTARFGAEATWAALSLVSGAVIAQQLGPDGKGVTAALGYLVALVGSLCGLGLGEAGVVLVRQRAFSLRDAAGVSALLILVASLAGAGLLLGVARLQFGAIVRLLDGSLLLGALSLPCLAAWQVLGLLVESQGRHIAASAVKVAVGISTAVLTVLLVLKLHRGVAGAMAATGAGFAVGALVFAILLVQTNAPPMPHWNADYARRALRFGVPVQLSLLLVGVSARADLLLVEIIKTGAQGGFYSVALTLAQLVSYGSVAIAATSFPRIADIDEPRELIERVTRTSIAVAALTAAALAVVLPIGIPLAFGRGFGPSIGLTYILLPSALLYSPQWVLCRAWAARGRGRVLLASFVTSTAVMLVGDALLIPPWGAAGAGVASVMASAAGLTVAIRAHHRMVGGRIADLLAPRWSEFKASAPGFRR